MITFDFNYAIDFIFILWTFSLFRSLHLQNQTIHQTKRKTNVEHQNKAHQPIENNLEREKPKEERKTEKPKNRKKSGRRRPGPS